MRWFELVLFCAVLGVIFAEPEPKKYKPEVKSKVKESNSSLTDDEKKFLREVETKFGIKSDVPVDKELAEDSSEEEDKETTPKPTDAKLPFPAVIAIEIVNDTDAKTKGKRTIDANLGYGYQTNSGYAYTLLGKSGSTQGKFMIYPYSQHDIPPVTSSHPGYPKQFGKTTKLSPNVEITPSQAYELVPTKEEETSSYNYEKPAVQLNTKYENVHSVESPPPPYPNSNQGQSVSPPSTLFTTYNGQHLSGLSGHFPKLMSNYLVDPSQLLSNPTYQSAGLTQDHLRPHGDSLGQRVVPVLVLRIPSSYIKDPSAELYADVPQNQLLSQYLKNVNLQELVNQYFKKIGYPYAPKVMTYPNSPLSAPESSSSSVSNYEPQHYARPYVQPSYTHADHSGVQYSAVQPVMAKYPTGYTRHQYYMRPQTLYQQPISQQPQYVYRYKYVPQTTTQAQSYYYRPQYQHQQVEAENSGERQSSYDTNSQVEYSNQAASGEEENTSVEYESPQAQNGQQYEQIEQVQEVTSGYDSVPQTTPGYDHTNEVSTADYGPTKVPISVHSSGHSVQVQYDQPAQKETISVFPRGQTGHKAAAQNYLYQNIQNEHSGSESLVLSENYPSKDHTIATVLPLSYKKQQNTEPVQSVSYVTPIPSMKYHSQYRVMVPQTILRRPTSEKVSYVNSHSYSQLSSGSQYNPEEEYSSHYVPAAGKQKPSSYPWNYHAHPKRMAKPENKSDTPTSSKKTEKSEKKKSS